MTVSQHLDMPADLPLDTYAIQISVSDATSGAGAHGKAIRLRGVSLGVPVTFASMRIIEQVPIAESGERVSYRQGYPA